MSTSVQQSSGGPPPPPPPLLLLVVTVPVLVLPDAWDAAGIESSGKAPCTKTNVAGRPDGFKSRL
jgi:hypothetical protein